jgi:chorismate mutase
MRPGIRHQLAHLDRTLLALVNERARLLEEVAPEDGERRAAIDDLLRRNSGPLLAVGTRRLFAALDEACLEVARGPLPVRAEREEAR